MGAELKGSRKESSRWRGRRRMKKAVCITVASRAQAVKALLCAFRPFGSLGGERLANLLVRWALATSEKRRAKIRRAINARLVELDDYDPSRFERDGEFPGVRTPTSGTHICLYWGTGKGWEGMAPHLFIDFNRYPSSSRMREITEELELAGLVYEAKGVADPSDEARELTPIARKDILASLVEGARGSVAHEQDERSLAAARGRLQLLEARLAACH